MWLTLFTGATALVSHAEEPPLWLRYPAVSPDGTTIAFTYAGKIWRVPATGGRATVLTPDEDYATRPVWSPDGGQLAFAAKRRGHLDVWVMPATGGAAQRLTQHSANDRPLAFSPDGSALYFASARLGSPQSVHTGTYVFSEQLYRVPVIGGRSRLVLPTPAVEVSVDRTGTRFLYEDRPIYENEWRKGAVSDGAHDVWLYHAADGSHVRLTDFRGEDRDPVWAPEGDAYYFLSERSGTFNLWRSTAKPGARAVQVTRHRQGAVRFPSVARDGSIVYGLEGEIWRLAAGHTEPQRVPITFPPDTIKSRTFPLNASSVLTEMQVSRDGRQVAFVARGEVFVLSTETGRTRRITQTAGHERHVTFAPDGRALFYVSERGGDMDIFTARLTDARMQDFTAEGAIEETKLVDTPDDVLFPRVSPDGRLLAYFNNRRTLEVRDLVSGRTTTALPAGYIYSYVDDDLSYNWSPDSRSLAVATGSIVSRQDITLVDATGQNPPLPITQSGYQDGEPRFSPDGHAVLWNSGRAGLRDADQSMAQTDIYLAHLTRESFDRQRADEHARRSSATKPAAGFPTSTAGIEQRTQRLTPHSAMIVHYELAPDLGSLLYVDTNAREEATVHRLSLTTGAAQELFTQLPPAKAYATDAAQRQLFVLRDGGIERYDLQNGQVRHFDLDTAIEVDPRAEMRFLFQHCWRMTKLKFYEPTMHGRDWAALREHYLRFLPHIDTWEDFTEMMSELAGELNASHMGSILMKAPPIADSTASLGLYFDDAYRGPGLRIAAVLPGGPADLVGSALRPGALLLALNDEPLNDDSDFDLLLNGAADDRVRLRVQPAEGGAPRDEVVVPVSPEQAFDLAYAHWCAERSALVEKLSGGRIGYVHIPSMDAEHYRHVYSEVLGRLRLKEALVIDVRYNMGGNLHDQLITLFTGEEHASFVSRDGDIVSRIPTGRWTRPTALVQNAAAYSDGSIFPRLFQQQKIGPIVGDRLPGTGTAVWWMELMGKSIKWGIPELGAREPTGTWFENREIVPDRLVRNDPAAIAAGRDPQIEAAVAELLSKLPRR